MVPKEEGFVIMIDYWWRIQSTLSLFCKLGSIHWETRLRISAYTMLRIWWGSGDSGRLAPWNSKKITKSSDNTYPSFLGDPVFASFENRPACLTSLVPPCFLLRLCSCFQAVPPTSAHLQNSYSVYLSKSQLEKKIKRNKMDTNMTGEN